MLDRRAFLQGSLSAASSHRGAKLVASLDRYAGSWERTHAQHLVRRAGFGAPPTLVDDVLQAGSAPAAAHRLVDAAASVPMPPRPDWFAQRRKNSGNRTAHDLYRRSDFTEGSPLRHVWFERMRHHGLAGKMALFWHNFFPIEGKAGAVYHAFDYFYTLCEHAFGNFKAFVHAIGLTPAMLTYLDGANNRAGDPNENYARELVERFTMGKTGPDGATNYTEQDIAEMARALTGWTISDDFEPVFDADRHDGGVKVIMGQRGLFRYDEVIDILFAERSQAIAHYVCRKLYCFFVQPQPDEVFIGELATVMQENDFELVPVLKALFASTHFYDAAHHGARIKSPIEFFVGLMRESRVDFPEEGIEWIRWQMYNRLGKYTTNNVLRVPNVGGWPGYNPPEEPGQPGGHRAWLSAEKLELRRQWLQEWIQWFAWDERAREVSADIYDPFRVAVDMAGFLLPVPLSHVAEDEGRVELSGDPTVPLPEWVQSAPEHVEVLGALFLDGLPHYNWAGLLDGSDHEQHQARKMIKRYVLHLTQRPEYHLT